MASYTTLFHLGKPTVGGDADVWGTILNTVIDMLDAALGFWTITGSSSAYVLTTGFSLPAYATGQRFFLKWNHTNASTTPTLNVDGLGAKSIKKRDGSNPSASDLVSGRYNEVIYDGTNMVLNEWVASDFQPLDATLTALAALSWSSGNPVVQFTAADTVSLTLTPSVSSITTSQGAAATTPSATFTNTTDNASVRVARFDGDRATPAANDAGYVSFYLSDSAGTQKEMVRLTTFAAAVTAGAEDARWLIGTLSGGSMTTRLHLSSTEIRPGTNDGYALGASGIAFADLYLATGGIINWNAGNFTLTHVTGGIEANGTVRARVPLSSETGTPTSASLNKKVALASAPTINSIGTADDFILFDPGTSSRVFTRGAGMTMYLNGSDAASATLAANQFGTVHWRSSTVAILSGAFS